ncbi:MAG TPA: cupredoxin domain-containing protein [Bryobacteraceae bacterium]|nr:cupredoxin domain-containing protein [Bryobacteraceae bacterium]
MNRLKAAIAAVVLSGGILSVVLAQSGSSGGGAAAIKMSAKKYEFTPNEVRVKKGDRVRLEITALDQEHGFKVEAFHVDQKLPKGETTTVEFTADQAGTFPFECSHFCGLGHGKMKGQLTVE